MYFSNSDDDDDNDDNNLCHFKLFWNLSESLIKDE